MGCINLPANFTFGNKIKVHNALSVKIDVLRH